MNAYNDNIFNDQYANAEPVYQNFNDMRSKLFTKIQNDTAQLKEASTLSGTMSDFKINLKFNKDHKLANNVYSYQTPINIFPFYKRKVFHDKYGKGDSFVSLLQVMQDPSLFSKRVRFKINGYMIMNVAFSSNNNGTTIILTPTKNSLYQSTLDDFITKNVKWDMIIEPVTPYGTVNKEKNSLFGDTNLIRMSDINMQKILTVEGVTNHWIVASACGFSDPGVYIYTIGTSVSVNGIPHIEVPAAFKTFLYTQTSICNMHIFGLTSLTKPITIDNRYSNGRYAIDDCSIYDASCINIETISATTSVIGPNVKTDSIVFKYPNTYVSNEVFNISNPLILLRINPPPSFKKDSLLCDTPKVLFDKKQFPLLSYISEYKGSHIFDSTLPSIVKNYVPYKLIYNISDFNASIYKTDFNSYMLSKLIDILHDFPIRYCQLYDSINEKYKYFSYLFYLAKSAPHLLNTSRLNNTTEVNNENYDVVFDEPQCYVSFNNSSGVRKIVNIYVDGCRIPTKYTYTAGFTQYVYIPVSKVKPTSIVELEILRDYDNRICNGDIRFSSLEDKLHLPSDFKGVASSDLIFYNTISKSYINKSSIRFGTKVYKINVYMIDDPEKRKVFSDTTGEYIDTYDRLLFSYYTTSSIDYERLTPYLKTVVDEFYITNQSEKIRLSDEVETVIRPSGDDFYKIVDGNKCFMVTDMIENLNVPMSIASTRFFNTVEGYVEDVDGKRVSTITGFRGDPSPNRFRVFLNGLLLDPSQYTLYISPKYGGTVTVTYKNIPAGRSSTIIDYLPMRLNSGVATKDITNTNYISIKKANSHLPISSRDMIFIDGKKYPQGCGIEDITSNRTVIANPFINTSSSTITVHQQAHDADVYGFSSANDINDTLIDSDTGYLEFLINGVIKNLYNAST